MKIPYRKFKEYIPIDMEELRPKGSYKKLIEKRTHSIDDLILKYKKIPEDLLIARKCPTCNTSSFKKLIKLHRCVAVADGFYEWKREEKVKTPYYFLREDKKNMYMAGIYENDEFCLITENASENISSIHHRQPVILNEVDVNRYLNLELSGSNFLNECNKTKLCFYEISKEVNKPTNNSISLIQQL